MRYGIAEPWKVTAARIGRTKPNRAPYSSPAAVPGHRRKKNDGRAPDTRSALMSQRRQRETLLRRVSTHLDSDITSTKGSKPRHENQNPQPLVLASSDDEAEVWTAQLGVDGGDSSDEEQDMGSGPPQRTYSPELQIVDSNVGMPQTQVTSRVQPVSHGTQYHTGRPSIPNNHVAPPAPKRKWPSCYCRVSLTRNLLYIYRTVDSAPVSQAYDALNASACSG